MLYLHVFIIFDFEQYKNNLERPNAKNNFINITSLHFVHGIGVGNFGTGIRHRSKFAVIFILLAAPLLKKIIFKKKD